MIIVSLFKTHGGCKLTEPTELHDFKASQQQLILRNWSLAMCIARVHLCVKHLDLKSGKS